MIHRFLRYIWGNLFPLNFGRDNFNFTPWESCLCAIFTLRIVTSVDCLSHLKGMIASSSEKEQLEALDPRSTEDENKKKDALTVCQTRSKKKFVNRIAEKNKQRNDAQHFEISGTR